MKLYKKLMAAALAGVMALSLLTGCGSAVNKKEFLDYLNDSKALSRNSNYDETGVKTIEEGDSTLAKEVLKKVKTYAENHTYENMTTPAAAAQAALASIGDYDETRDDYANIKSIVPKDTKDAYYISYARVVNYQSKDGKNASDAMTAQRMPTPVQLNKIEDRTTLGDKAVASIANETIGGEVFLVVVYVQAAK